MMMFMATMMIMIIVMIFYIWIQWFCSLKNHERCRYLWRKIIKDINIYDATGIERVMKRLSKDIASVFSKLIASLWCYFIMRKRILSQQGWFYQQNMAAPPPARGGGPQKFPKKEMSRNVLAGSGGGWAVFFVFNLWKGVCSGGRFWWRLHPFCLLCKTETFKRILMRLFKIYRPPFLSLAWYCEKNWYKYKLQLLAGLVLPSSGESFTIFSSLSSQQDTRWCEKYLSKRGLIKHTYS